MKCSLLTFIFVFTTFSGCSTVYYNFWETFGKEKRELLQSHVTEAKEGQEEVKEQFQSVLERIKHEYSFEGGSLEETYEKLQEDYEEAAAESSALSARVEKVSEIGEDLFEEWENEAQNLDNKRYKRDSLQKLRGTKKQFKKMLASMLAVEKNLDATLKQFHDQVIYLKHNLNAKALGSFKGEFQSIQDDMRKLVRQINQSSQEAEEFVQQL